MLATLETYDLLASLVEYPNAGYRDRVMECYSSLSKTHPTAAEKLEPFIQHMLGQGAPDMEELFASTFDIDPVVALEVGWHLYGENYSRGAFLVKMRQWMRQYGVEESTELPDHLSHALAVVGRMEPAERENYVKQYLLPALDKMLKGFESRDNPYRHALAAIREAAQGGAPVKEG